MAGDEVSAHTLYYYKNPVANGTGSTLVNDVLGSLLQTISGSPITSATTKGATGGISTNLNTSLPFNSMVAPDATNASGTNPKAYLTVLFFDERFNYVGEGSAYQRVQG